MFYHTYNTEAFVLGSRPSGEASRYVYLFTRDLGLVGAHAQGARSLKSKMRYALEPLSHSKVSLVRGKKSWKLTGAAPDKIFFLKFAGGREEREKLALCANTFALIRKLVTGEEKNPELFEILDAGFSFLECADLKSEDIKNTEAILMLRILNNLGYFGGSQALDVFVKESGWSAELLIEMSATRRSAISIINKSLEASHLHH